MSQLGNALFTTTQQAVLGLFFGRPDKSFYLKEVLRLTGMGVATIKRELDRMLAAGILTMHKVGNQHHYQANPDCPIYGELLAIVKKTFGVVGDLQEALSPLAARIDRAFVFGSMASGSETSGSDIDLLIIGDLVFSEVVSALYPAQASLQREINPKVYSESEWAAMERGNDPFFKEVMSKPQLDVIGGRDGPGQSRRQDA